MRRQVLSILLCCTVAWALAPDRAAAQANVELRTSAALNPVAGETFRYTYELTNLGPSDAFDVLVLDSYPAAVSFVDADGAGNCTLVASGPDSIECRPARRAEWAQRSAAGREPGIRPRHDGPQHDHE